MLLQRVEGKGRNYKDNSSTPHRHKEGELRLTLTLLSSLLYYTKDLEPYFSLCQRRTKRTLSCVSTITLVQYSFGFVGAPPR